MKMYAVITADIIGSRQQSELMPLLKLQLKEFHSRSLLTSFSISRGDEIQAVCRQLSDLPVLIRQLRFCCLPLKLRIAVGIGAIAPETLEEKNSWDMNGEAFYLARDAMDQLKKSRDKKGAILVQSGERRFDITANAIYRLYDRIVAHWTAKQWETVHAYETYTTFVKTAAHFDVSWQTVQKICKAANWELVVQTEADLAYLLEEFWG